MKFERPLLLLASLALAILTSSPTRAQTITETEASSETKLEPVVISSELERSGLPLGFQPGSFYQKSNDEIKSPISRSLLDVARDIPGVAFLGGPRMRALLPQIRGLGADRVLILEDGTRQNFQSGHSGRIFSDIGSFEELEVVKGPLSSMFGSGALGGVINLRRPTARDLMKRSGRPQGGEIIVDTATVDESFGQRFTLFGVFEDTTDGVRAIEPIVSYSRSEAENIALGSGAKLNYSARKTDEIYAGLGAQIGTFKTNLKVTSFQDEGRTPLNSSQDTGNAAEIADTKNIKNDIVLAIEKSWISSSLDIKPFVRESRVERARITDQRRDVLKVETVGLDGHYDFTTSLASRGRTVIGIEGYRDNNRGERAGVPYGLFPNGETLQYGAYVQQPIDVSTDISVIAGLRADRYESKPSDSTLRGNDGSAYSPKLYVIWEIEKDESSEQNVFVGWGRGFNAPRLQDLYVSGLHFPGQPPFVPNNFFQANPDLKPEVADTFEAGTRGRINTWSYNFTAFLTEANDFIMRDVNIAAGTTRLSNIDRAALYGGEFSVRTSIDKWGFDFSTSLVRGINRRADEPMADTPADRFRLAVDYAASDAWLVSVDSEVTLGQERVPNGVSSTGGYTLFGATTSWAPSRDWVLSGRFTNLLNRAYHRHGSQIDDAGRDFRIALTARF